MPPVITSSLRDHYERRWIVPLVAELPEWSKLHYLAKQHCSFGYRYVAWHLNKLGQPELLDILTVTNFVVNVNGPSLLLQGMSGRGLRVTSVPTEVAPGAMMWLPGFLDVRWAPANYDDMPQPDGSNRKLSWALCLRMGGDPMKPPKMGETYLQDIKQFRQRFPHLAT